jgi:hypothetical protein
MVDLQSFMPFAWRDIEAAFPILDPQPLDGGQVLTPALRDVVRRADIVRAAVRAYLGWIERERLGAWQLTGTGQGFAAFRARFYRYPLLVHWDEDARAAERTAMWAGRTEAYWHGTLRGKRIDEWDMAKAYPTIARDHWVPSELCKTLGPGADLRPWLEREGYAVLAEITARTEVPTVPSSHDGRILWPVGEFDTTLWDPELRLLFAHGGNAVVRRAWVYRTSPALEEWATWILKMIGDRSGTVPAWQQAIGNHWSRAVIGRLGMQHDVWELLGQMPRVGIRWWTQRDRDTGIVSDLVHVGREVWESTGKTDWSLSIVAVPSWISSQCRANLTTVWLSLPARVAIYADTDSLFTEGRHAPLVARVAKTHPSLGLRRKRSWNRITILGPRQLVTGDRVRVSGVPVRAQLLADGTLQGEVRESLRGAIANARPSQVRVTPRRWHLREVDRRRAAGEGGWTDAIRLPVPLAP